MDEWMSLRGNVQILLETSPMGKKNTWVSFQIFQPIHHNPSISIDFFPRCPLQYHLGRPFLQEIRIGVAPGSSSDGVQLHLLRGRNDEFS